MLDSDFFTIFGLVVTFDLLICKSNEFTSVWNCTEVVSFMKFPDDL